MNNVKGLLRKWKHDLEVAKELEGTELAWSQGQINDFSSVIEELEGAVSIDESWKGEEDDFSSNLNIQRM